jgi:serine protease Do
VSFSWAAIVLSTLVMPGLGGLAHGQRAIQAAIERAGPVSPDKRAELYRELRSQAEFLERQSAVIKTVARLVGPTVVFVEADATHRATGRGGRLGRVEEAGSGVVIALGGRHYILTSRHVVAGTPPEAVEITLADGRHIHPTKVWDDIETDVAVMAVSAPDLVAAALGDSNRMEIGDFVLAVGSPFGLSNSVTFGIISAKGRRDLDLGDSGVRLQDFLQTDAAINPGNSGGPLVNLRGEVIGINTAIASRSGANEGVGFAIPINMFMVVASQLIEHGKVSRAFLGVTLDPAYGPAMAAELGLPRPAGARGHQVGH